MRTFQIGERIKHHDHGEGEIELVGDGHLGIRFDNGLTALVRISDFGQPSADSETPEMSVETEPDPRDVLAWPDDTFVSEEPDERHFMGAHWDPFFDEPLDVISRLPEILPKALLQTGYGERLPKNDLPAGWVQGFHLAWPARTHGLTASVAVGPDKNILSSLFPFFVEGSQQTLTLSRVHVWEDGMEAQIEASWGEAGIAFFDTQFLINRSLYRYGKRYDFILTGIAYEARTPKVNELVTHPDPDMIAWEKQRGLDIPLEEDGSRIVYLNGMAMLMQVDEWDRDDYRFRGPIKSVRPVEEVLGQSGWMVRVTVLRFGDDDADLDILVTRRAWQEDREPTEGEDLEGTLWLQGYLWMPQAISL
jgi:hypothetical protein